MPAAAEKATHLLLLSGDDDLAIKQKAKAIFETWAAEAGGFDQERISAAAANSSEALNAISKLREAMQTLPFFGAKVIWFQNCNFLGTDRTSESAAVSGAVASLADDLKTFKWEGVRLLITATSIDKRKAFYKTIAKLGSVEEFDGWSVEDRDWIEQATAATLQQLRALGCAIDDDALGRLVNDAGVNNRHLANEIEKLTLYLGDRKEISMADVEAVVSRNRQSRSFALADAIGARDLRKLVRVLDNDIQEMRGSTKKTEIGVLFGVISKVRSMLLCKEMTRQGWIKDGATGHELQAQLKRVPAEELPADKKFNPALMHPFVLQGALQHSRNYTLRELVSAMEALLQANLQLISTGLDESIILQQTLIKIVQPAPQEPGTKKQGRAS